MLKNILQYMHAFCNLVSDSLAAHPPECVDAPLQFKLNIKVGMELTFIYLSALCHRTIKAPMNSQK